MDNNPPTAEKEIKKMNKSLNRFLYYAWGVWVTAYARYNLFTAIQELGDDYVYSDTDSVKYINYEKHEEYFKTYNENIIAKLEKAMMYHGLSVENIRPKNKLGVEKPMGIWDDEGVYTRFKTLGAKRYMTEKNGKINITVSGLNKSVAVPWLIEEYGEKVFDAFADNLHVPAGKTGKLTHTYLDEDYDGYITDYLGNKAYYHEKSAVHLCPADYSLSLLAMFVNYYLGIQDETRGI